MLAPHELKNKSFSRSVRGYNPSEVDDHIEFLIEKYTELYRENTELNRKLRIVGTKLDEIKDEEESIRSTLVGAQKMGEKIIREANEKANLIINSIKERCDAVIDDFKRRMVGEKEDMWRIRTAVLDFKQQVFDLYRKHIEELQGINVNRLEEIVLPDEQGIVESILGDVAEAVKNDSDAELIDKENANLNPAAPQGGEREAAETPPEEQHAAPAGAVPADVPDAAAPAALPEDAGDMSADTAPVDGPAIAEEAGKSGKRGDEEDFFIKSLESFKNKKS